MFGFLLGSIIDIIISVCQVTLYFYTCRGASLDTQNKEGLSPIMKAACQGHVEVVEFLAQENANLKNKDRSDQTIIHLAARHDQADVIEVTVTVYFLLLLSDRSRNFCANWTKTKPMIL